MVLYLPDPYVDVRPCCALVTPMEYYLSILNGQNKVVTDEKITFEIK